MIKKKETVSKTEVNMAFSYCQIVAGTNFEA